MPRNSSGNYTLPAGNPVVSGTVIEASWANDTLSDLAAAMTDSLSRDGEGGMTAPLRIVDGSASVPGLGFSSETGSGIYRNAAGDYYLVVLGAGVFRLQSTGVSVTGTLGTTGNATIGGNLTVTGNLTFAGPLSSLSLTGDLSVGGNETVAGTLGVTGATTVSTLTSTGRVVAGAALQEKSVAIAASNLDMAAGNYFSRTISGTTTFTVSNVPTTGTAIGLILDLTNGGSATINWWSGVKWAAGTAPTLTSAGRDVLGFFTYDGGTTWTGLVLAKDVK